MRGLAPQTKPSKVPHIRDILYHTNQLFIALTETWLNGHTEAELKIEEYSLFRTDRPPKQKRRGRHLRGVCLYIRDSWAPDAEVILSISYAYIDVLGVYIASQNLFIAVIYRQPDDSAHGRPSTNQHLAFILDKLSETVSDLVPPSSDILVMGDVNLPHANYETWQNGILIPGSTKQEQSMISSLTEFANEFFLEQIIDVSTHEDGNTPDVIFTNNVNILHSFTSEPTSLSDHFIVECKSLYQTEKVENHETEKTENVQYNFDTLNFFNDKVDWAKIEDEIADHPWKTEFNDINDHKSMIDRLIEVCYNICVKYVPKKKCKSSAKKSRIPRHRKILMRRRTKVHKHLKQSHVSVSRRSKLKRELINIEYTLQQDYTQERNHNEENAVSAIKNNYKHFFSYANKFSKIKQGIGPLTGPNSEQVSCPKRMAEILSNQYASVWTKPSDEHVKREHRPLNHPIITDINFTPEDIEQAINELSSNSAAGPDTFPAILLKKCKLPLSTPLYMLWRQSMNNTDINHQQKSANIIPIHKGGSKAIPKNYRPIALTSHLTKIFEKVIRKALVQYLERYHLLNMSQHGFRAGRSCVSQLLAHFDTITKLLEDGHDVDIVYVDFAKAFDKVDINIVMHKVKALGIQGVLADWIHHFLSQRTQQVVVNSHKSPARVVLSGVPQGSVLGPLIFLILIGDIDKDITHAFLSSFADDTRVGKHIDNEADVSLLQNDLQSVYEWCDSNNMSLNADKFEHLPYKFHKKTKCYIMLL